MAALQAPLANSKKSVQASTLRFMSVNSIPRWAVCWARAAPLTSMREIKLRARRMRISLLSVPEFSAGMIFRPGLRSTTMHLDRQRLAALLAREQDRFSAAHPRSRELFERAQRSLLGGVPMNWMVRWAGSFPIFVREASGAHFTDVDGHRYLDLCLGDTGAMTGHAPKAVVEAVAAQARRGITFMLPTEDAVWVGEELSRRFGLPFWQTTLTATDANRFAIRLARHITGRPRILVFNWCYHGTVDETFITLKDGAAGPRSGNLGPPVDPATTTRVVEFNDVPALEAALAEGDVACVLAEPVMTNIGIVHPQPGFHEALREITRRTGTLLILDETHTISAGTGRLHARARPLAGHPDDRQADRRRCAGGRLRTVGCGRRADPVARRRSRRRTRAASAARSPATRCRSRRCARLSSTS